MGEVHSQPRLVLTKRSKLMASFYEGDRIRFQRKGEDDFTNGVITGIHRDFIKLGEYDTIYWYEIKKVDVRDRPNMGFVTAGKGRVLIAAGVILLLADVLNPNQS